MKLHKSNLCLRDILKLIIFNNKEDGESKANNNILTILTYK